MDFSVRVLLGRVPSDVAVSSVGEFGVGDGERWLLNRAPLFAELSVGDAFAVDALDAFVDGSVVQKENNSIFFVLVNGFYGLLIWF